LDIITFLITCFGNGEHEEKALPQMILNRSILQKNEILLLLKFADFILSHYEEDDQLFLLHDCASWQVYDLAALEDDQLFLLYDGEDEQLFYHRMGRMSSFFII
jgi:hypothetical protein